MIQRWTEVLNGVPLSMKPRCGKKSFIDGLPSNIGISMKIPIGNVCLLVGTHEMCTSIVGRSFHLQVLMVG